MTGFLTAPRVDVPLATEKPSGFFDRFGAAFTQESIRTDAWMRRTSTRQDILTEISENAFGDPNRWRSRDHPEFLREIANLAEAHPEDFREFPKTPKELEGLVNNRLRREYDEAAKVLARSPEDAFAAETLGILARAASDEIGVASAFAGLGVGTALRVGFLGNMAIEGAFGGVGEALVLPREFQTAEQLDLEDPDVLERILLGIAGGAAAGAVLDGTARVIVGATKIRGVLDRLKQSEAELHTTGGVKPSDHQIAERQASRAVTEGRPEDLPEMSVSSFAPSRGSDGLGPNEFRNLSESVIEQESSGNPAALGPVITKGSNKGDRAIGLMQVMPNTAMKPGGIPNVFETARSMGIEVGEETKAEAIRLLLNPKINRTFGEAYLKSRIAKFNGDTEAGLIAYNAGDGNAQKFLDSGRDWSVLPQREQTEPYVRNILGRVSGPEDAGLGFSGAPRRYKASELTTEPDTYQFKDRIDSSGRTGSLAGESYDEASAGALVVHERLDGRRIIADGHERFALASQAGDDTPVNAITLREADGWTVDAVIARTGIMDFLQRDVDATVPQGLARRQAALRVQRENPDLFRNILKTEEAVKAGKPQQKKLAKLTKERDRLINAATERPADAPLSERPNVKDIAKHVRGGIPEVPAGRGGTPSFEPVASVQALSDPPAGISGFADPQGVEASISGGESLRELERLAEVEGTIEFDGVSGRELIRDAMDDAEFLADLEACPTGKV